MNHQPPAFHKNAVLFGHDPTPRLLAFELDGDDGIRVFVRTPGGRVESQVRPFRPFALLASTELLSGWTGGFDVEALAGEGLYRFLVLFHGWNDALKARAHLSKVTGKTQAAPDASFLFLGDPIQQYLMLSGQTHFLELPFRELRRMQLDIETYCAAGYEFPNATRAEDRITAIALSDSTGWEHLISGQQLGEPDMLRELVRLVTERDPDVIEGHNLFRFDLEYIAARAARHKVKLHLGRGGAVLRGHPSRMQIAERAISYKKFEIFGRHIVDTWILAQHYDVTARELEGYGLKEIAKHFGLAMDARTYILPEKVSWYFDHEPETLFRYALDDVRETRGVSEILSQSYFAQAQIFPFSYQNAALRGNATKIDALLIREYLRQRRAIPGPEPPQEVLGGHTEIAHQGVARRVLHCDVTSLYPSVMLAFGAFPRRDSLGVFPMLLTDLRAFRVEAKQLARTAETAETRAYYEALQTTFKILINSFYGYLGFSMGHFNDYAAANQVTAKGRELIQAVMAWLKDRGARLIEIDTDGLYFVAPPDVQTPEDEERLLAELTSILQPPVKGSASPSATPTDAGRVETALRSRSLLTVLPIFFALGLLLSLTPCVLPMLPILSSIIVGQSRDQRDGGEHGLTKTRGFVLALAYALGMAIVYTGLGIAAGLVGEGLAAALQQPWILASFAALLVALALSMFGFYELQLPSAWQTRLAQASARTSGGRLAGVLAMGAISALIVGPCVAAPLAGALLYISQTHDVAIGGSALFAMATGMSVPLLLVGVSAGSLLPRAGPWMESIKRVFGVLLIAVALWTISPVIPASAQMLAWAALLIVGATYLSVLDALPSDASGWQRLWKGVGLVLLVLGAVQIVGAASGGRDVLRPLERLASAGGASEPGSLAWRRVESIDQLNVALADTKGRPVVLDFYADWCVSCKEMDRFTFNDPRIASKLAGMQLLRADVTANDAEDRALLKRFGLFGPPGTIFFDGQGVEVLGARVIGFESPNRFLTSLARAMRPATGAAI